MSHAGLDQNGSRIEVFEGVDNGTLIGLKWLRSVEHPLLARNCLPNDVVVNFDNELYVTTWLAAPLGPSGTAGPGRSGAERLAGLGLVLGDLYRLPLTRIYRCAFSDAAATTCAAVGDFHVKANGITMSSDFVYGGRAEIVSWLCSALREDDASIPTPQKRSTTVLVSPIPGRPRRGANRDDSRRRPALGIIRAAPRGGAAPPPPPDGGPATKIHRRRRRFWTENAGDGAAPRAGAARLRAGDRQAQVVEETDGLRLRHPALVSVREHGSTPTGAERRSPSWR